MRITNNRVDYTLELILGERGAVDPYASTGLIL